MKSDYVRKTRHEGAVRKKSRKMQTCIDPTMDIVADVKQGEYCFRDSCIPKEYAEDKWDTWPWASAHRKKVAMLMVCSRIAKARNALKDRFYPDQQQAAWSQRRCEPPTLTKWHDLKRNHGEVQDRWIGLVDSLSSAKRFRIRRSQQEVSVATMEVTL